MATGRMNRISREEALEQTYVAASASRDAQVMRQATGPDGWHTAATHTLEERLGWWREARFGAFIHWGPYSELGGRWRSDHNPGYSEHIMRTSRIPVETYRKQVAASFRPNAFDAREWVRLFVDAGMGYVIITAKHHDGFAIWPSDVDDYNIRDTAGWGRDPLRELVDAARDADLHVGFYYSHAFDWKNPDAPGNDWDYENPGGDLLLHGRSWWNENPDFLSSTDRYLRTAAIPQLLELIERYDPDILWFDTPGKLPFFQQAQVVQAVREASPRVVINGRAARTDDINLGDYANTADRPAELRPTEGDWEAIPTTNESYGWNVLDESHKPASHFVDLLARAAAGGGNILLNIGPRGDGTIDEPDVRILEGVAGWMKQNVDSLRGTTRTPLDRQAWGESTRRACQLYLHVLRWPRSGELVVAGLKSDPESISLSGRSSDELTWERLDERDFLIRVPVEAPDPMDSVITLEFTSVPEGEMGRLISTEGENRLTAFDATTVGEHFEYGDGKSGRYHVSGLEVAEHQLIWHVRSRNAELWSVEVLYDRAPGPDSGEFVLTFQGSTVRVPLEESGAAVPTRTTLGLVDVEPGGASPLTLHVCGRASGLRVFELRVNVVGAGRH